MPAETQFRTVPHPSQENSEAQRDEWIAAVEQIITDAEAWAAEQHWFVHRGPKTIADEPIGPYEVPTLLIQAPAGRFVLEPMGRFVGGGVMGRIDFSVFPSYEYMMVIGTEAGWQFETNPRSVVRPWSKSTFLEVVSELARKA